MGRKNIDLLECGNMNINNNRFGVGLFFYVNGKFLLHKCSLEKAEDYGDFLVYPKSHYYIWDKHYYDKYDVDFDYYPRGRIVYRKSDDTFLIYYDTCISEKMSRIEALYEGQKTMLELDEHYQCHICNENYVI